MMDNTAFHTRSYGLYIVASKAEDGAAGCVVNTFQQVTSTPLQVSVALNKENATTGTVRAAGRFTAACLTQSAGMELIGTFGFRSSKDLDKFATCETAFDASGMPYVAEQACARFSARVVQEVDLGTHVLFVGEVEEAERLCAEAPMTYAYYHQVKGGKTPPKASSYLPGEDAPTPTSADAGPSAEKAAAPEKAESASALQYAWRCTVCGHLVHENELPDGFVCPVCGVGKEMFERVAL